MTVRVPQGLLARSRSPPSRAGIATSCRCRRSAYLGGGRAYAPAPDSVVGTVARIRTGCAGLTWPMGLGWRPDAVAHATVPPGAGASTDTRVAAPADPRTLPGPFIPRSSLQIRDDVPLRGRLAVVVPQRVHDPPFEVREVRAGNQPGSGPQRFAPTPGCSTAYVW